jgi:hypothetical protein
MQDVAIRINWKKADHLLQNMPISNPLSQESVYTNFNFKEQLLGWKHLSLVTENM